MSRVRVLWISIHTWKSIVKSLNCENQYILVWIRHKRQIRHHQYSENLHLRVNLFIIIVGSSTHKLSVHSAKRRRELTYLLESRTLAILHRIYGIERHAEWMNWFITSLQMGVVRLPFVSQMTSSGMLPLTQLEICSHLQTYVYLTYTYT